jgi:hypothetical protein
MSFLTNASLTGTSSFGEITSVSALDAIGFGVGLQTSIFDVSKALTGALNGGEYAASIFNKASGYMGVLGTMLGFANTVHDPTDGNILDFGITTTVTWGPRALAYYSLMGASEGLGVGELWGLLS